VNEEPKKNNLIPIIMWLAVVAFGVLTMINTLLLACLYAYLIGISGG